MWTQVKRKEEIPWQAMDDSTLILNPKESKAHELNSSATLIWKSIEGWTNLDYLIELICNDYHVEALVAKTDILEIIEHLKTKDLVEWQ